METPNPEPIPTYQRQHLKAHKQGTSGTYLCSIKKPPVDPALFAAGLAVIQKAFDLRTLDWVGGLNLYET